MFWSRNIWTVMSPVLVMCYCSGAVLSSLISEEESSAEFLPGEPLNVEYRWRLKRMNQISCHCCSNSFNSHCCLQCMHRSRVGKRSGLASLYEDSSRSEHLSNMDEQFPLDVNTEDAMCSCCLQQMQRIPSVALWPCCTECTTRYKRSLSHLQTEHL